MQKTNCGGVTAYAPAKINLVLDVLGRRPDGYHDIRSLVTPVSLCDTLRMTLASDGIISTRIHAVALPGGAAAVAGIASRDNLATRAATLFFARSGLRPGCRIEIAKRIPVGAGLGGGSADGAGVLLGLNALFDAPYDRVELARMGAEIGCDVPALVLGGAVRMTGRGETVAPLFLGGGVRRAPFWLVLLNPGFAVPTGDIYRRWIPGLTLTDEVYKSLEFVFTSGDVQGLADGLWNSLQSAAFTKYPALELLADALRVAGARGVLLAGSGGTVFGLAGSCVDARRIRRRAVDALGTKVWSRVVKTMPDGVTVAHGPLEARV